MAYIPPALGWAFLITFLLMIALNVYATYVAANTPFKHVHRKWLQLIMIWLIPLLGSLFVIVIDWDDYQKHKQQRALSASFTSK